jgi:hypothetical protein
MTKDGRFKKVVRRHAEETGQRYTETLTNLEELQTRMFHRPAGERLVAHLRDRYGIDAVTATRTSQHHDHVFALTVATAIRGWHARSRRRGRAPASKAMPRSCGSWNGTITRRSGSQPKTL